MQSRAHREATKRWTAKAYSSLTIKVPKGLRENFAAAAEVYGFSLAKLILISVAEYCKTHPINNKDEDEIIFTAAASVEKIMKQRAEREQPKPKPERKRIVSYQPPSI